MYDMLKAWTDYNNFVPQNIEQLSSICPWYNTLTKPSPKQFLHNPMLYNKNIITLQPFINKSTNKWYNHDQFQLINRTQINYLDYLTIVRNLPKEWENTIKLRGEPHKTLLDVVLKQPKPAKTLYQTSIQKKNILFNARNKWELILNIEISDKAWQNYLLDVYKVTNCTKLRWFQFRLLNHIVMTNLIRSKWEDVSPLCSFCQNAEETIVHLLTNCIIVKDKIWKPLYKWLDYFCNVQVQFDPDVVIFNAYKDSFSHMTNTIILITKQYIYSAKCLQEQLYFPQLVTKISLYKKIRRSISKKKQKNSTT